MKAPVPSQQHIGHGWRQLPCYTPFPLVKARKRPGREERTIPSPAAFVVNRGRGRSRNTPTARPRLQASDVICACSTVRQRHTQPQRCNLCTGVGISEYVYHVQFTKSCHLTLTEHLTVKLYIKEVAAEYARHERRGPGDTRAFKKRGAKGGKTWALQDHAWHIKLGIRVITRFDISTDRRTPAKVR